MQKITKLLLLGGIVVFSVGCIPQRQHELIKARYAAAADSLRYIGVNDQNMQAEIKELNAMVARAQKAMNNMAIDTAEYHYRNKRLESMNDQLREQYESLIQNNKDLLDLSYKQKNDLNTSLNSKDRELQDKQQAIRIKEDELAQAQLANNALQADLIKREARVKELENIINSQEATLNALKERISQSLYGFGANDLSVEVKEGKVYVSISDKLLFKSGSTQVDRRGVDAIERLAGAIARNSDFDVYVEGHTDNVPITSIPGMSDNWDLSVLRATAITRILINNGVPTNRVIPSGRGEYMPKGDNSTNSGKAQNRRTEIILSPKLDDLYNLLER